MRLKRQDLEVAASRLRGAGAAQSVLIQLVAFVSSLLVLVAILWAIGHDPGRILAALWDGSAGSTISLGVSLDEAVPLILTATAFWLALEAGVFNIGMDGQLQIGGLAALVTTFALPADAWPVLVILLAMGAGMLAGAAWSGIAGVMKTKRGSNEIISTLMLNFVAFIIVAEVMRGPLQSESNRFTPQTDRIRESARIDFTIAGVELTWGIIVALALSFAAILVVRSTNTGLRLRAVGLKREAARHAAVPIERYWLGSFLVTGALSGLAGALVIEGLRYYIAPGWAPLWGFEGIVIAFLALRSPLLIPVWAILFGMLASAGPVLKGTASVPDAIVNIMQTLPVIVLFILYAMIRSISNWQAARRTPPKPINTRTPPGRDEPPESAIKAPA